jgi:lipopolysaccharide/colanic/teichoic acid biosynthesis glycosyltransferase
MRTFDMPPRVEDVAVYADRACRELGRGFERPRVHAAIAEALLNAVVYGALRIPSSREREPIELLGEIRAAETRAVARALRVEVEVAGDGSGDGLVRVIDDGPGFDWQRQLLASKSNAILSTRGRGIMIMQTAARDVAWNDAGNQVSLRFARDEAAERALRNRIPPAVAGGTARARARLGRILTLARRNTARAFGPLARRAIDIVLGSCALVAATPILLAAAALVKLTSKGPAFVSQPRGGLLGRPFTLYKIRSMYQDAEARRAALVHLNESKGGVTFKIRNDPRITPVGRVLRKLSIDELPQLWNVVQGSMSIVGPRPHPLPEVAKYDTRARRRMERKPGLTGLWQVSGRSDLSFDQLVELDLAVVDRLSPLDEAELIAKTIPAVLSGRGAY